MKKQKKSSVNNNSKLQNGITLIALVISIIVMLILAGVSINAIVGENGVLTKAQNASIESKKAGILEAIDLELASYNIDTILNKPEETSAMLSNLMSKGLIDTVLSSNGQVTDASKALAIPQFDDSNNYTGYTDYGVKKEDYSIILSVDTTGIYKAKYGEVNISSGGSVAAGTTVVTGNAFNSGSGTEKPEEKGKFTIDNDASVMFVDEIEGELSIHVKSGTHAKVNVFKNMTLTNNGLQRSAIDIEAGGILDLYVAEGATINVDSGFGVIPPINYGTGANGGTGANAGIHVPKDATLNLYGSGTIKAYGGKAGNGGECGKNDTGGAGGGGAGAGIGGNGGAGGKTERFYGVTEAWIRGQSGKDGENGEDCGNINIYNSITVYAYSGAGGSGGLYTESAGSSGTGGGGYPAAGIGGGGAGGGAGMHIQGGGGYSPGICQEGSFPHQYHNGTFNSIPAVYAIGCNGGSYFTEHSYDNRGHVSINMHIGGAIGGQGGANRGAWFKDSGGDGGIAGKGGKVLVSKNAKIFAYNGNECTLEKTDENYYYKPVQIFGQNGIHRAVYKSNMWWNTEEAPERSIEYFESIWGVGKLSEDAYKAERGLTSDTSKNILVKDYYETAPINYILEGKTQGIGSGAGYIEISNGTYEVKDNMD